MIGGPDAGETLEVLALEGDSHETGRQLCRPRDGQRAHSGVMAHRADWSKSQWLSPGVWAGERRKGASGEPALTGQPIPLRPPGRIR